jgi:hypothetical protein
MKKLNHSLLLIAAASSLMVLVKKKPYSQTKTILLPPLRLPPIKKATAL